MTFDRVKEVIVKTINCNADEVTLGAALSDQLAIDSLDAVELSMALEEEFGVAIPDEEMMELKTVSDIVTYIDGKEVENV